jgi:hypothetical protein
MSLLDNKLTRKEFARYLIGILIALAFAVKIDILGKGNNGLEELTDGAIRIDDDKRTS